MSDDSEDSELVAYARDMIGSTITITLEGGSKVTEKVIGFDPKPPKLHRGVYLVLGNRAGYFKLTNEIRQRLIEPSRQPTGS